MRRDEEALQSSVAKDLINQILQTKPGGTTVVEEYEESGTLRIPQRKTKEKYALGIVTLFPALKDPLSRKGYEHYYDSQSGSGFLAWRLKTIQRKTKPEQERKLSQISDELDEERCKELISFMNHTNDREIILQKMETFSYRQRLIHNPDESHTILSVFQRLLDTKGLINLLFGPDTSSKLLQKWHTFCKEKVIGEAESLTTTPVLQSLLKSARNQYNKESSADHQGWDSDMASYLLLPHILPPQPSKKKTKKINAAHAMDHLVVFHKSCRSLEEHLESQEGQRQPFLLASGTLKQAISTYYIVIDKMLIPCQGATSLAAFDELIKAHFVFGSYGIDVDGTKESPKVKELRAKFLNNV
ncbi:hypothetical protein IRJ41_006664 [Triplophysa rosa]|uniref:Uncharacterized protein n=1 Tax=Triplophysa rosa TaxID=992332 RepID=A0A9W8CBU0_TRIRA|nr:hypothetical protein IRJ41_006664 [Triplophysa rosa]